MKTLVIQLARLGDILQTLPALNAYCRTNKNEEVHFLVRHKFSQIAHLLPVCSKVIEMDTKSILASAALGGADGTQASLDAFDHWIKSLRAEGYTKIINLSFSPFSSYLSHLLSRQGVEVLGYTRHADGFLAIPDDASAYFYAQVGVDGHNRFHLIDLFSSILGVDLVEEDWNIQLPEATCSVPSSYIVVHVGASSAKKALPISFISQMVMGITRSTEKVVCLIGSSEEKDIGEEIMRRLGHNPLVKNLVGMTSLSDLISVVANAELYIGADSGPLQICNLTNTTCVNFSNDTVNFWETGPRTEKSFVCYVKDFAMLNAHEVSLEIKNILDGQPSKWIQGDRQGYYGAYPTSLSQDFQWNLVKAIYLGEEFPEALSSQFAKAVVHLNEVNEISLHHLSHFQLGNKQQASVIETADQIMDTLAVEVSEISPLVFWFRTEKIRMGPMGLGDLILKYEDLHKKLRQVLEIYIKPKWEITEEIL